MHSIHTDIAKHKGQRILQKEEHFTGHPQYTVSSGSLMTEISFTKLGLGKCLIVVLLFCDALILHKVQLASSLLQDYIL